MGPPLSAGRMVLPYHALVGFCSPLLQISRQASVNWYILNLVFQTRRRKATSNDLTVLFRLVLWNVGYSAGHLARTSRVLPNEANAVRRNICVLIVLVF